MLTSYTIDEARKFILDKVDYVQVLEQVDMKASHGRIIAEDIVSQCNVPGFKRSIMDGYAVKFSDIAEASRENQVRLKLIGKVEMGRETNLTVSKGECVYIPTGGMLPAGADSVLIIENTKVIDEMCILAYEKTKEWENIVFEDEDVKCGEAIIKKGKKIRPYEMGVLSSIGRTNIPVFKKLRVGILVTGDEIVTPYETPKVGQVRDINSYLLEGLIRSVDCEPIIYNIKTDVFEEIYAATEKAVYECDVVLVSGGSSVGVKDFTKKVFEKLPNTEILFHGLALKPGKPTLVAKSGTKMLFGMPGHPLACAVVFKTLVKYYIDLVTCYNEKEYPVSCKLAGSYKKAKGREEYIPVSIEEIDNEFFAMPIVGKSGIISTFSKAYGYFRTNKECNEVNAGEVVAVYKL